MQLGMVGLGRMGANMTRRLMRGGHQLVVSDLSPDAVKELAGEGAGGSSSLEDLVGKLKPPRAVWVMVPAGAATEQTVQKLAQYMQAGDAIIDGGNSYFKDDVRRAGQLKGKGIHYMDVGTSGGVWGIDRGYCMMIGGPKEAVRTPRSYLQDAGTRQGRYPADARPGEAWGHGGRRLHSLRPFGFRSFCEDGSQRD